MKSILKRILFLLLCPIFGTSFILEGFIRAILDLFIWVFTGKMGDTFMNNYTYNLIEYLFPNLLPD